MTWRFQPHPISNYALLKACFAGKTEVYGAVVRKYQSCVCTMIYRAIGDFEKSEELAQEVFVIVWENLPQLKDYRKFKSWLCRITRNHISHFLQNRKRDVFSRFRYIDRLD